MTTSRGRSGATPRRWATPRRAPSPIREAKRRPMYTPISRSRISRSSLSRRGALIVLLLVLMPLLSSCGINNIPTYEQQAKAAWAQVLNQYQRRADLIPNLVQTVKGAANFETKTLQAVVEARAKVGQMQLPPDILNNPQAMQQFEQNQAGLTSALSRLMVVVE